jgi:hypothetical protein
MHAYVVFCDRLSFTSPLHRAWFMHRHYNRRSVYDDVSQQMTAPADLQSLV